MSPFEKMDRRSFIVPSTDLSTLSEHPAIGIFGRRLTGKTTWGQYLVSSHPLPKIDVFCGNEDNVIEWQKVPNATTHSKDALDTLVKEQGQVSERLYHEYHMDDTLPRNEYGDKIFVFPHRLRRWVVFDDCGYDREFMRSSAMRHLVCSSRRLGVHVLFLCQSIHQLDIIVRDQLDHIGLLKTNNQKTLDKIFMEYISECICPRASWFHIVNACTTKKFGMCWIDNSGDTFETRVFHAGYPRRQRTIPQKRRLDNSAGQEEPKRRRKL